MSDLSHLFHVGEKVRWKVDGQWHKGTVRETYTDHIIVDIPSISDHCYFENGYLSDLYPESNFCTEQNFSKLSEALERLERRCAVLL